MSEHAIESQFQEAASARREFSPEELTHLRFLLRKLRFLETKEREGTASDADVNTRSAVFGSLEKAALEWILTDIEYLQEIPK